MQETNIIQPPISDIHPVIRFLSRLLSFVFHPLFIPFYITFFLAFYYPFAFAGMDVKTKGLRVITVFLLTAFFPAFTVFLLWRLKFISSIYLRTQKERIIPYIASMFFYFWVYYVFRNIAGNSPLMLALLLGVFISSIAALMANIYFKVSMHAMAMGGMLTFFMILSLQGDPILRIILFIVTLIAGLVSTARLLVSDHYPFEIYTGFALGIISQVIALLLV